SMTMSTSSAPLCTASLTSASLTASEARPDGKAVATDAMATLLPASAVRAVATRSGYTHTAATGGTAGSPGSGRRAFAHMARTLPGVSAPSSVVRSIIRIEASSAHSLASRLMDLVARLAARASAPTWSTPGSPCSTCRSAASEVATSVSQGRSAMAGGAWPVPTALPGCPQHGIARGLRDREAGLEHRVDDVQPLVERRERALHRVDGQPLDVGPAVAERVGQGGELRRQGHPAHQPVVGIDRHPEGQLAEQPDRVLGDRRGGAGLHVGRRAHLQRDPAVPHVAGQPAQRDDAVRADPDVVHDADAVAEPLGAAPLQRLPDRREPEPLPRMDRDMEVLPGHILERVQVAARRATGLGPGDIESDYALVAVADRKLGDLPRAGRGPPRGG